MQVALTGKPIAITGASSGIGRATALACARAGMPVAVLARQADRLEALCEQIRAEGGKAVAVPGSVDDAERCSAFIDQAANEFGSLYAVFANAGYSLEEPTWAMDDAAIRRMFEVNFHGSLNVVRPALERMRSAGSGHVLFCSSSLSKIAAPCYGCYSATKACQDHFARAMRLELESAGVFVSSVHPIGTRTELFKERDSPGAAGVPNRTPSFLMQSSERVARAVVSCLRRPRGEVWTSVPTRLAIGVGVMWPGLADRVLRRMVPKGGNRPGDARG